MVRIVNGEVVDDACAPPPSSSTFGSASFGGGAGGRAMPSYRNMLTIFFFIGIAFVLGGFKGLIAGIGFYMVGSLILFPPTNLPTMPGLPSAFAGSSFSGGGAGGGSGGGSGGGTSGRSTGANVRGVADLPARPRG
mmetsp:Transcript_30680/g.72574  ORF Transcript_30680/g.72574 Transcript_30680/m.72574 type:complete len:136 (+) Transcript_30680:59-466(+)